MSNRRSFLRLLGMAPIAAPAAAKEAAAAMGLSNGIGVTGVIGNMASTGIASGGHPEAFSKTWILNRLADCNSAVKRAEIKRQITGGMVLDADIAAMRSIAPAMARQMQMERLVDRQVANETDWLRQELARVTGGIL